MPGDVDRQDVLGVLIPRAQQVAGAHELGARAPGHRDLARQQPLEHEQPERRDGRRSVHSCSGRPGPRTDRDHARQQAAAGVVELVGGQALAELGVGIEDRGDVGLVQAGPIGLDVPRRGDGVGHESNNPDRRVGPAWVGRPARVGCLAVARRPTIPPLLRQLRDPLGLGSAARSARTERLAPRTQTADRVARSVCPYCAVGCGQRVFVKDERVVQIEGDPDSPISRGRLCPKGAASLGYVTNPQRLTKVRYRPPHATEWQDLELETAMDMIADRIVATRAQTWEDADAEGRALNRTLGIAVLGGATLDSEENYLLKKSFTALGAVSIENQARI